MKSFLIVDLFKFLVFYPLSKLWASIYWLRRRLYKSEVINSYRFPLPVISVGNIAFGGSGKTPVTIWISKFMEERGLVSCVLTRGYKGQLEDSKGILKSKERFKFNPMTYGDEALLLVRKIIKGAVIVGKRRAQNLIDYWNEVKPDVVVLDDGFQHLKIQRDVNIVLFDGNLPLSQYETAPRGYLREGLSSLCDADMAIITRSSMINDVKKQSLIKTIQKHSGKEIPVAEVDYRPTALLDSDFKETRKLSDLGGQRVIALSGIASPKSFYDALESFGAVLIDKKVFRDHHQFTEADLSPIIEKAEQERAIIVVTEKDLVKIKQILKSDYIFCLAIEVEFKKGQVEFEQLLLRYV